MRALTLVEVLAALVLVGGCVTVMLIGQGSSLHQLRGGLLALDAREAAEELIAAWRLEGDDLVVAKSGRCDGFDDWTWHRTSEQTEVVDGLIVLHVTVELRYAREVGPAWSRRFEWVTSDE